MAFTFSDPSAWRRALYGLGGGLMARSQGAPFSAGLMQGFQNYDAGQQADLQRKMEEERLKLAQQEAEDRRTAASKKAEFANKISAMLNPGMAGPNNGRPGGMAQQSQDQLGGLNIPPQLRSILGEAAQYDPEGAYATLMKFAMDKPDQFKPDLQTFNDQGITHSGYYDQNGQWVEMGASPQWQPEKPAEPKIPGIVTLYGPDGSPKSFRENDPQIDALLGQGYVESAPKTADGPKPPSAADLRGEYIKATKDYEQAAYGYGKVVSAANNPSPAGDIAMIFGFMKTLDPNSTVREGEFATAQNAGSVPERIVSLYNSVVQGTRLTDTQRKDFINQAKGQFSVYEQRKKIADQFYSGLAQRNNLSPQDVIVPYGDVPRYLPTTPGGPDERGNQTVIDGVKIRKVDQ